MLSNEAIANKFKNLFTPQIADACVRLKLPFRIAKYDITPIKSGSKIAGNVLPTKHFGSVDIFFEVMETANAGDIMVIDNENRKNEACIGDLTAIEAKSSDIIAFVINGLHRDTQELIEMNFPVFSSGSYPAGPTRADTRSDNSTQIANFGDFDVTRDDYVFGDDDGVIFVSSKQVLEVLEIAQEVRDKEILQAEEVIGGKNMRAQLNFSEYLEKRAVNTHLTFREHLRDIGGAIEE